MSPEPAGSGPRLVYDATGDPSRSGPKPGRRRPWIALLVAAALLLALFEWQRAAGLETRVAELSGALARAETEVAARRAQIDAIRSSVADVRERVAGLAALAAEEPTDPSAPPANSAPTH